MLRSSNNNKTSEPNTNRTKKKTIGMIAVSIGNLAAITAGTFAWFVVYSRSTGIELASGDLNVKVNKISAYKYVYPFYDKSTEFVDYNATGTVTKYVLQDTNYDKYTTTSPTCTITLGSSPGSVSTNSAETHSQTSIYYGDTTNFRYYLIGDETFNGVSNKDWYLSAGHAFANVSNISDSNSATLENVVVSEGSSFILFDKSTISNSACTYLTYFSIKESNTCFSITDNKITCLQTGIYTFTYSTSGLTITTQSRDDDSIIGNNCMDPTMITVDYVGSADKSTYETLASYVPTAIQRQNTMVILDVELKYNVANDVLAGLKIVRNEANSKSIHNLDNKYNDTTNNLTGYVSEENRNVLNASDFYSFYAVVTKTAITDGDSLYTAMHYPTDQEVNNTPIFSKFPNGETFQTSVDCTLNLKENTDSLTIPANNSDQTYHCYIGIEYDYEYSQYFLNEKRLGNTYLLDRDFGFYFTATQILEN
jgi:hypothetical protein